MHLDINTPKGQETLEHEQIMLDMILEQHPDRFKSVIQTPKLKDAKYDGIFVNHRNEISAVFESKCRDLTYKKLVQHETWLITHEKLVHCAEASKLTRVPFIGLLYLIPDKMCLMWKITDDNGNFLFSLNEKVTETRANVNGGKANRNNAFLNLQEGLDKNLINIVQRKEYA